MAGGGRGLDETATWSVAMVCAVIVVLSIMMEKALHHVGHNYIAAICVSKVLTKDFLPCKKRPDGKPPPDDDGDAADTRRRLLWFDHRRLAGDGPPKECKPGFEPLITVEGLHQLHIFIFFLAVFHVIYSALTMIIGRAKIREWKVWEKDILQQQAAAHAPGSQFNFQKYIKRSLEDDFKVIVGISPLLWSTAVLYLFANVEGTHAMIWLSLFPVVIILAVGTKLQGIIAQMAIEIQERHAVIQGIPLVQVTDKHFWFQDPTLILYFIQLTLFMYEFGLDSCFHEKPILQYGRVLIGIAVQILCSYSILPLYSLITQMGSKMKRSIFDDQTSKALKHWHKHALKRRDSKSQSGHLPMKSMSLSSTAGNSLEPKTTTDSPSQTAHIVASVDIPQDKQKSSSSSTPNLL
ncbi:mlo-related protein [Artemisia annua]|uniref:MLO-like protein n=1 Tax=Artemisia annua TaxID=35608 RepID=A0A2U1LY27_ARTAN|nr:mlo-related protein [Artemisia annua]